ncbi:hypothetical protein [Planctomicrobium piriforme]|uniref:Protein BatD n=1 Tax=Planctomicrobium piriforme TaxID=1576369 RepID=A0A1I3JW85_9PLAN|nr:hypothetical protein [Planctomicrobium piriforme]SFI64483.1 hypothetical protein SAMN05421753_11134 [Planctomicrobium piriforme]
MKQCIPVQSLWQSLVICLAFAFSVFAEEPVKDSTVGLAGRVTIISQRDDLIAMTPEQSGKPVRIRVVNKTKADAGWKYDVEYVALKPGEYDIATLLVDASGERDTAIAANNVTVGELLNKDTPLKVSDTDPVGMSSHSWYRLLIVGLTVLWLAAGVWLWKLFPDKKRVSTKDMTEETLREYVTRALTAASAGQLTREQYAVVERMVLTYWQDRLGLQKASVDEMLAALKMHPQAGPMLWSLESLHRPGAPAQIPAANVLGTLKLTGERETPVSTFSEGL